jgi:hypothetical protein
MLGVIMCSFETWKQLHIICKKSATEININANDPYKISKPDHDIPLHEVPVLCYHQIRNWEESDSKSARGYIMPPGRFKKQIKVLVDSGYHFILPDQLLSHILTNNTLPQKPIMISFDDGTAGQFTEAIPILNDAKIKAVFFIMTVVLNRPITCLPNR